MMKFGSAAQATYGVTPASSVSVGERLVFIKKVYGLLALSLVTAAIGAHLGSDPNLLLIPVASNMMLFFILQIGLVFFAQFAAKKPGLNMVALFSFMQGFLFTGLMVVVIGSLLNMFFGSSLAQFMISGAAVLLFSGFILYDTSNILRYY